MNRLSKEGPLTHLGTFLYILWEGVWWPPRRLACLLFGHDVARVDGYFLESTKPVSARVLCHRCKARGENPT